MAHLTPPPHMSASLCGEICITPPQMCMQRKRAEPLFWLSDAVFHCERETTLFVLPKEDTARNQWFSCVYNTVQNSSTQILDRVQRI